MPRRQKLRLGAEIVVTYGQVRWLLRRRALPETVAELRRAQSRRSDRLPLPDGETDGVRLGRLVQRTLSRLPANTLCLMQSLVLLLLLARRQTDSQLVIAVARGDPELSAHAWIELDGRPLLPSGGESYGRLLTL